VSVQAGPVTDRWRPGFHFAPVRNWMNDPNGLVFRDGVYHLFFQHNPYGDRWGSMSWGHAVSTDLVRWRELPVALRATAEEAYFSGSAVADADGLVAALTTVDAAGRQSQALARSVDGLSWAVDPARLSDPDPNFRDPKLIRTADGWLLLVALSTQRRVRFYRSADLRTWVPVGEFGPAGAVGGAWEMPDLLRLPVDGVPRDVLVVGVIAGGPGGGSGTQYFLGSFDGRTFTADDQGWVDHGPDFYAAASFSGLAGRTVWLAWMNDWRYAEAVPTSPWRGVLTVPREVGLRRIGGRTRLVQRPVPELRRQPVHAADTVTDAVLPVRGDRLRIDAELTSGSGLVVRRSADGREGTRIGWEAGHLVLDRRTSGIVDLHPDFAAAYRAQMEPPVRLTVLVDRCSVEVFAGAGEVVLSAQVFPGAGSDRVAVQGEVRRLTVSRLIP
jgi:fructan beta-fructosidase